MELSIISSDTLTTIASTQSVTQGISNFILNHRSDQQCCGGGGGGPIQISAGIFPIDAVAAPPVRSNRIKTLPRRLIKKRRRTRRRSLTGGDDGNDDEDDEEILGFSGDGGGDFGGPFDNNNWGGGGSGKGGNFGGPEWWGDFSSNNSNYHDPAFDFVYEVLSWIVLSNCLHFAYKKVVKIVADGLGDPARGKVPIRLASVY